MKFCDDLSDVPPLSGPIMPTKAALILQPDYNYLAKMYNDAGWKWCREMGEPHPTNETFDEWKVSGWPPTETRIKAHVEKSANEVGPKAGDYIQFGGMVVFRSKSGIVGLIVDALLGEHYKRIKGSITL